MDQPKDNKGWKLGGTEEQLDLNSFCLILHEVLQEFVLIFNLLRDIEESQTKANANFQQDVLPFLDTLEDNVKRLEHNIDMIERSSASNTALIDHLRALVATVSETVSDREHGVYAIHVQQASFNRDLSSTLEAITKALLNDTNGWGTHVETTSKIARLVESINLKLFRFFTLLGVGAALMGIYNFLHWLKVFLKPRHSRVTRRTST